MTKSPAEKRLKPNTVLDLLEAYEQQTRCHLLGSESHERALWYLLKKHADSLPEFTGYFHKAFRQTDVTDSGETDMAIWCLLQNAPKFWKLFEDAQKGRLPRL